MSDIHTLHATTESRKAVAGALLDESRRLMIEAMRELDCSELRELHIKLGLTVPALDAVRVGLAL